MSTSAIVLLCVAAGFTFWLVGAYNRLVRLRARIVRTFVPVHTQLRHREVLLLEQVAALTPLLMNSTHATHATDAAPRLDALRAACQQCAAACAHAKGRPGAAGAIASLRVAEDILSDARARLPVQSAAGTDLSALNTQLLAADSALTFARQLFNAAVVEYNAAVAQFPTVLIVGLFGFRAAGTF